MKSPAETSIQQGDLQTALDQLQDSVRDNPADAELRIFLFQLLSVMGYWNRALTQVNIAADIDSSSLLMAQTYRELLLCESYREAVFNGQRAPLFLGEPPAWLAELIRQYRCLPMVIANRPNRGLMLRLKKPVFALARSMVWHSNGYRMLICVSDLWSKP